MPRRATTIAGISTGVLTLVFALAAASPAAAEGRPKSNLFWWPEQLDLQPLRQHAAESDPMGEGFDYAAAFKSLDLEAVKRDIETVLTTSQD